MTDSHGIPSPPRDDGDPYEGLTDDRYEMLPLARAALWAGLAAFACFIAVIAARTEAGHQRLAQIFGSASGTATVPTATPAGPSVPAGAQSAAQILNLIERVQALEAERDRLAARLAAVERHLDVTASVPRPGASGAPASPAPAVSQAELAIDLGAAPNVEALRALWTTIRTQSGELLDGLRPLAAIRDTPSGIELRLVVGPVASGAHAARLCTSIAATGRGCRSSAFEGQRLALQ